MPLVDTHCHIDLYPDFLAVIDAVERAGVATIAVTNTPSVFRRCVALTHGCRFLRVAVGLHPELAHARHRELPLLEELLGETRYVGEVGLDYVTRDPAERALQRQVFATVLERCAGYGDKVLTIHSRRAADDVVAMLGADFPGTAILHWFSGSAKTLDKAVSQGCFFSINPTMLESAGGRRIIAALPRERVLTETDGPFVAVAGRPAQPGDVARVIAGLARSWVMEHEAVADLVWSNFLRARAVERPGHHEHPDTERRPPRDAPG